MLQSGISVYRSQLRTEAGVHHNIRTTGKLRHHIICCCDEEGPRRRILPAVVFFFPLLALYKYMVFFFLPNGQPFIFRITVPFHVKRGLASTPTFHPSFSSLLQVRRTPVKIVLKRMWQGGFERKTFPSNGTGLRLRKKDLWARLSWERVNLLRLVISCFLLLVIFLAS